MEEDNDYESTPDNINYNWMDNDNTIILEKLQQLERKIDQRNSAHYTQNPELVAHLNAECEELFNSLRNPISNFPEDSSISLRYDLAYLVFNDARMRRIRDIEEELENALEYENELLKQKKEMLRKAHKYDIGLRESLYNVGQKGNKALRIPEVRNRISAYLTNPYFARGLQNIERQKMIENIVDNLNTKKKSMRGLKSKSSKKGSNRKYKSHSPKHNTKGVTKKAKSI